jgi:hypothetical protein
LRDIGRILPFTSLQISEVTGACVRVAENHEHGGLKAQIPQILGHNGNQAALQRRRIDPNQFYKDAERMTLSIPARLRRAGGEARMVIAGPDAQAGSVPAEC